MKKIDLGLPNANIVLYENFFSLAEADYFLLKLLKELAWQEKEIRIFGKMVKQPRLVAFYGNDNISYQYSGVRNESLPWSNSLLQIKNKLFEKLHVSFNSCLANLYRRGADSMGWHQDNEKELGENPVICSVSFGAVRKFKLKHISNDKNNVEVELAHGSVLLMGGETQHFYKHQIPKTTKSVEPRVNLTFRNIMK